MGARGEAERGKARLFFGIELDEATRAHVERATEPLVRTLDGVRWVPRENLHVTVKFLGGCDRAVIPDIVGVMSKAVSRLPLELEIGGTGGFPSVNSARVIWVGVSDPGGRLAGVFRELENGVAKLGFKKEKRSYRPHITVGRAKGRPVSLSDELLKDAAGRVILGVTAISLFESRLKRSGAEYSVVHRAGPETGGQL